MRPEFKLLSFVFSKMYDTAVPALTSPAVAEGSAPVSCAQLLTQDLASADLKPFNTEPPGCGVALQALIATQK